jgi:hypothetical protein
VGTYPAPVKVLGQLTLDAFGLAGLGAIVYGVHQIYVPAAWIIGGLLGTLAAAAMARRK